MSDKPSNLPDLNEITSMAGKLFNDVKTSVTEIIHTYKQKREHAEAAESTQKTTKESKPVSDEPKQTKSKTTKDDE